MLLNCGVGEDSWESFGLQGDQTSQSYWKSVLNNHWKDWCWSWSSNTLATWCEEPTLWKRPWCWESLKAGGEEDDRGWDCWMASPRWLTRIWVDFRSWWWTGKPGMLQSMRSQGIGHDWATEMNQYSCLENSIDRAAGGLQSMVSQRVRCSEWATNIFIFSCIYIHMHTLFHKIIFKKL